MLNYIEGTVKKITEKFIVLDVNGFGFSIFVAQSHHFTLHQTTHVLAHLHWNQDNGPALYGFTTELEKELFLMVINCSKIGPALALKILSHFTASECLTIIHNQDTKSLSSVSGIGVKKAEQIIVQLKYKVDEIVAKNPSITREGGRGCSFQDVAQVLSSLNYTSSEIKQALHYLKQDKQQDLSTEQLVRKVLSYLNALRSNSSI